MGERANFSCLAKHKTTDHPATALCVRMKLSLLAAALAAFAAAAAPVRGVPRSAEGLYASKDGRFTCLDKSRVIDAAQVNDDYCDCPDGSDEPGTSACVNGVRAAA